MSPKNTLHGGPSHAGDPPPPRRRSFGAVLAAARTETPAEPAFVTYCPTCGQGCTDFVCDGDLIDGKPILDGWATYDGISNRRVKFKPCGHVLEGEAGEGWIADWQNYPDHSKPFTAVVVSEAGPELVDLPEGADITTAALPPADDTSTEREHVGVGEASDGIEVPADGTEHELTTEVEGGEQPSPGNSSSTLPQKPKKATAPGKQPNQSRARTTGSRSKKAAAADSTADSAAESATNSPTNPDEK